MTTKPKCPECESLRNQRDATLARQAPLERDLARARQRIEELEQFLAERDAKIDGLLAGMPARGAGAVRERLHAVRLVLQAIAGEEDAR